MIRIFFLLLFHASVFAQSKVSFSVAYSGYGMGGLKEYQNDLGRQFLVQPKATYSFPSFWSFTGSYTFLFPSEYSVGGLIGYTSTGGRLSYSDYSGEQLADQLIRGVLVGASMGKRFKMMRGYEFEIGIKPLVIITSLDMLFKSTIGANTEEQRFAFKSFNLALEPDVSFSKVFGRFFFRMSLGYNISLANGKLYLSNNNDAFLINSKKEEVKADWSGYRLAAGVGYNFK